MLFENVQPVTDIRCPEGRDLLTSAAVKLKGDPALAGYEVRLTALNAGLDNWTTPATYILKADTQGDLESAHSPAPGPYDVALHTQSGWESPSQVLGTADKALDQYVVGGWPNKK